VLWRGVYGRIVGRFFNCEVAKVCSDGVDLPEGSGDSEDKTERSYIQNGVCDVNPM